MQGSLSGRSPAWRAHGCPSPHTRRRPPIPPPWRQAYLGGDGILSVPSGELHPHLLIDCSTIDPLTAREVAAAASDATLHPNAAEAHDGQRSPLLIDAPVSGGVPGATAGSLTFMVGGRAGGWVGGWVVLSGGCFGEAVGESACHNQ